MKVRLRFYECEHGGDLANYAEGVILAGGSVLEQDYDPEAETGFVVAEVSDLETFKAKLNATGGADFCSGIRVIS